MKIKFNAQSKAPPPPHLKHTRSIISKENMYVWYLLAILSICMCVKGVFKGGGGFRRFKPAEIFRFFLKSEGKEIERKRKKGCWGRGYLLTYFWD